jgi:hypothetical protein
LKKCPGGKLFKERLRTFFYGFTTGEMEKLVVIRKAAKI